MPDPKRSLREQVERLQKVQQAAAKTKEELEEAKAKGPKAAD